MGGRDRRTHRGKHERLHRTIGRHGHQVARDVPVGRGGHIAAVTAVGRAGGGGLEQEAHPAVRNQSRQTRNLGRGPAIRRAALHGIRDGICHASIHHARRAGNIRHPDRQNLIDMDVVVADQAIVPQIDLDIIGLAKASTRREGGSGGQGARIGLECGYRRGRRLARRGAAAMGCRRIHGILREARNPVGHIKLETPRRLQIIRAAVPVTIDQITRC